MTTSPSSSCGADDSWQVGGRTLRSRFLLGTARYPSPEVLREALIASGTEVVTVGLQRTLAPGGDGGFVEAVRAMLKQTGAHVLPNTAGCRTAKAAIELAQIAREMFDTPWIKLEVIGDAHTLQPDPFDTVEAARVLVREGFVVWPYCTDDLITCQRLHDAGCAVLMPWGAPIGTGQGLLNPWALRTLRERLPDATLIVDAGLGAPSHAMQAMELGFDAVLLSTAVGQARDPVRMARAFRGAIEAGRLGWQAGIMPRRASATASTPVDEQPKQLGAAG